MFRNEAPPARVHAKCLVAMVFLLSANSYAAFDSVPIGEMAVAGGKTLGGVAWGDFNNDTCPDSLIGVLQGSCRFFFV